MYLNLGQLVRQQCYSLRVPSHAYPLFMKMVKWFVNIQYLCGEKVRGVVKPQPCQHIITSSHYPKITQIWVNCWPAMLQFKGALTCLSTFYEHVQMLSIYTIWMWWKSEGSCKASTLSPHYYFIPLSQDYSNLGQLVGQQCSNAKVPSYAYPLHMNIFKCFLYIQYRCGEKVRGVVQPQPCQHIIILPQYPHGLKSGSTCWPAVLQFGAFTCLSTVYEHVQNAL